MREFLHGGQQAVLGGFPKPAKGRHTHDLGNGGHGLDILFVGVAFGQLVENNLDMEITLPAGRALSAALLGEEFLIHAQKVNDTGALVDDHNAAGTDHDASGPQIVIGIGCVQNRSIRDFAGCAAELNELDVPVVLNAAGQIVDDFPHRGAEGNLKDARLVDISCHADELGAEFYEGKVTAITKKSDENGIYYSVSLDDGKSFEGRTVIYALGTERRKLNVKGEAEYTGKGVSYCAVCDGAFYRKKTTAVAGGGDTALGDALLLSKFAQKVYIIHRRNELRANKALQEKVKALPNVEFILNADITEIKGEKKVAAVKIIQENREKEIPVDGVFVAVGSTPSSELLKDLVELDNNGYVVADENGKTSESGIFAAGDVRTKKLRQVITAASDGANCLFSAEEYLGLTRQVKFK